MEIQASIADNILTQRYIRRPLFIKYFDMLIILLLSMVLGIALFRLPMIWQIPFSAMLMFIFILINQIVFTYYHLILLWVYPILNIWLLTTYIFVQRYFTEGREKRYLKQAFQQYLSPSVVSRIMESPDNLSLGGEKGS
ncbi:MAG: hypothetical protein HC887_05555 [Desulfobacteraceae bacterium]|nr:hypothetical protein [Desulfobacteraceae bacterium]